MKRILSTFLLSFLFVTSFAQANETVEADRKTAKKYVAEEAPIIKGQLATPVKNQQQTGTCWAFSTTSLIESQAIRNNIGAFDISEMYIVRNIYIEKAKNYVLRQGKTQFGEGALGHDVIRAVATYGAVPENIYTGLYGDYKEFNHAAMVHDLKQYLDTLLSKAPLPSGWLVGYINMLNKTMGIPPSTFDYKNKTYTPLTFAKEVLRFNPNDYVNITSFLHHPFYQPFVLEVPDNFSNGSYYNVPLNEMMEVIKNALSSGYTVMWDADVSNSGFLANEGMARYQQKRFLTDSSSQQNKSTELAASDTARQRLFENLTTQDDHLMHIVSMEKDKDGKTVFNVKNSWGENGPFKGYIKASEAYLMMNTISIIVPRAALPKTLLDKMK